MPFDVQRDAGVLCEDDNDHDNGIIEVMILLIRPRFCWQQFSKAHIIVWCTTIGY